MECQDMKQVSFLLSVKTVPSNWAARNSLRPSFLGLTLLYSILSSHWTPTQTLTLVFAVDSQKPSLSFPG